MSMEYHDVLPNITEWVFMHEFSLEEEHTR